jgi:hypothetical protein
MTNLCLFCVILCIFQAWNICYVLSNPHPHQWARAPSFTRFLYHTQWRTTVGRTNLDERSTRLPSDNTRHSQKTNIHAPCGFRTRNPSKRAAPGLCLRPRGHWDRLTNLFLPQNASLSPIIHAYVFTRAIRRFPPSKWYLSPSCHAIFSLYFLLCILLSIPVPESDPGRRMNSHRIGALVAIQEYSFVFGSGSMIIMQWF